MCKSVRKHSPWSLMHLKTIALRNISCTRKLSCKLFVYNVCSYVTCVCTYAGRNVTENLTLAAILIAELHNRNKKILTKNMTYSFSCFLKGLRQVLEGRSIFLRNTEQTGKISVNGSLCILTSRRRKTDLILLLQFFSLFLLVN